MNIQSLLDLGYERMTLNTLMVLICLNEGHETIYEVSNYSGIDYKVVKDILCNGVVRKLVVRDGTKEITREIYRRGRFQFHCCSYTIYRLTDPVREAVNG